MKDKEFLVSKGVNVDKSLELFVSTKGLFSKRL